MIKHENAFVFYAHCMYVARREKKNWRHLSFLMGSARIRCGEKKKNRRNGSISRVCKQATLFLPLILRKKGVFLSCAHLPRVHAELQHMPSGGQMASTVASHRIREKKSVEYRPLIFLLFRSMLTRLVQCCCTFCRINPSAN